jgi:hypothetical protein
VPSGTVSGGWFGSLASSAADPANEAALTPNGTAAAAAVNSRLPSGGPANSWPMVCTAYWLPLACGSCSARTSCGSTDCDALLNTTSPTPRPNAATASTAMSVQWTRTRTARTAMTLPCRTWARHISAARSCRSTRTPAGSESSSQGRNSAGGHQRDHQRIPGDRDGQQRQRGHQDAVAGGADRAGPPQTPVRRAESSPLPCRGEGHVRQHRGGTPGLPWLRTTLNSQAAGACGT